MRVLCVVGSPVTCGFGYASTYTLLSRNPLYAGLGYVVKMDMLVF